LGRFYLGDSNIVAAKDFRFHTIRSSSPILNCLKKSNVLAWKVGKGELFLPASITQHLRFQYAMFQGIEVLGNCVGVCFVGRCENNPFSDKEKLWFSALLEQAALCFSATKKD